MTAREIEDRWSVKYKANSLFLDWYLGQGVDSRGNILNLTIKLRLFYLALTSRVYSR